MDGYSGKRAIDGLVVSRTGLVLRDTVNSRDQTAQFCSRIGCSSRLNSMKNTQIGCSNKAKSMRPSFRSSSSGKEVSGSSSKTYPAVNNTKKTSSNPQKKLSCHLEADSSETSSVQDEPEVPELVCPPGKIQRGLRSEAEDADSRKATLMEIGSSSIAPNTRSQKNIPQRYGLHNQDSLAGSSAGSRSNGPTTRAKTSRYGLRNLRCNSVSDVIPSNCSPSSSDTRRKDVGKRRNYEAEGSSFSRGKKVVGASSSGLNDGSSRGVSITETRRSRNWPPNRDSGVASVRTRRSTNVYGRASLANQGSILSLNESSAVLTQVPQAELQIDSNLPLSSPRFSTETPPGCPNSYSLPGTSSEGLRGIMSGSPSEVGMTRSLMNRDSLRHYNMDGIAEVLLALERIEQDEELTYEQLLVLETNLFLNGLNFYDQHRDMRLDIDNMSYEELLALEDRMGTVSTALSEEALSKCLETCVYQRPPQNVIMGCGGNKDDIKCSICQEEYVVGEEVGRLRCEHSYHVVCIHQWLRLKNWCPICKASAEAASASPSSSSSS